MKKEIIDERQLQANPFTAGNPDWLREDTPSFCLVTDEKSRQMTLGLPAPALALLLHMGYMMQEGSQQVTIDPELFLKENGFTASNTYRSARNELMDRGIITATSSKNVFWVNPAILYCD